MSKLRRSALFLAAGSSAIAVAGCSAGGDCVEVDEQCQPQYEPTFDNIFSNTINPSCALPGTACHSVDGARGGLIFEDPDQSYSLLISGRVDPGDDSCSELARRVGSTSSSFQMPPGAPLEPGEICAIERWIANGAER